MKKVAIIVGSNSDLPIAEKAVGALKEYGVPFEVAFAKILELYHFL